MSTNHAIGMNRRQFLRGTDACLSLPFLESLCQAEEAQAARRFVCVANPFGMIRDVFYPDEVGIGAKLPKNLEPLDAWRGKFTVFSNLDHGIGGGHSGTHAFLSGVRRNEAAASVQSIAA